MRCWLNCFISEIILRPRGLYVFWIFEKFYWEPGFVEFVLDRVSCFTLKLPIQTPLSVASTCSVFWCITQFEQNDHIPSNIVLLSNDIFQQQIYIAYINWLSFQQHNTLVSIIIIQLMLHRVVYASLYNPGVCSLMTFQVISQKLGAQWNFSKTCTPL